jgi:hypothetical protein
VIVEQKINMGSDTIVWYTAHAPQAKKSTIMCGSQRGEGDFVAGGQGQGPPDEEKAQVDYLPLRYTITAPIPSATMTTANVIVLTSMGTPFLCVVELVRCVALRSFKREGLWSHLKPVRFGS